MSPPTAPDILAAFKRLLNLPVMGPVTLEIWNALNLGYLQQFVIGTLAEKAELTSQDNELHSGSLIAPFSADLTVIVTVMTWPKPLSQVRDEAREQFLGVAGRFGAAGDFAGALQFDLFLSENEPPELRMAWLPFGSKFDLLPELLRKSLLPWGTGFTTPKIEKPLSVGGREIVELAESAWKLSLGMQDRLRYWTNEEDPPRLEFIEAREHVMELVGPFNLAATKIGLSHSMPVSKFDDTWLPHNLDNALRFRSLPATLKADLLRVCGPDASHRFTQAWALFEEAYPRPPAQDSLNELIESPLALRPQDRASLSPQPVDVFISYAWSDKTRGARDIYQFVTQSGLSAWIDEEQRLDDSRLNDEIAAAMLRSKRIVICVSLEMLTRGGYAMHEVLLALASAPERCVIARLDRIPLPEVLSGLRSINWFEPNGAQKLAAALQEPILSGAHADSQVLKIEGPIIDKLIAFLKRPVSECRHFDAPTRRAEFSRRAKLFVFVSNAVKLYTESDWKGLVAAGTLDLLKWSALNGPAAQEDPTVLGSALRLRSVLFRARVQLGAGDDWEVHNHAAYELLEETLNLDLQHLRPGPKFGWLTEDCRLAHQDCLDIFSFAQEWFRGWSPQILIDLCSVPADLAATVEERLRLRMALLGERMMALRAWEDCEFEPEPVPAWTTMWSTLRRDLTEKLRSGAHPHTKAYFEELNRCVSVTVIDELATAIADSVTESRFTEKHREELFFDLKDFRLRCIICSRVSLDNKRAALASFRGTVLNELRGPGSKDADLNIMFAIFTQRNLTTGDWGYGLFLNCAPSEDPQRAKRLPSILLTPFLTVETMNDDERRAILGSSSIEIYEEF
jgi:hypothetical protein